MNQLCYTILLVSLAVATFISMVSGQATCVVCESNDNELCGEVMTEEQIRSQTVECNTVRENICMKTKVNAMRTSWTAKNGRLEIASTKISRFCGMSSNYPWSGCWYQTGKAGESWVCSCQGDACNSSTPLTGSLFVAVCLLIINWLM